MYVYNNFAMLENFVSQMVAKYVTINFCIRGTLKIDVYGTDIQT